MHIRALLTIAKGYIILLSTTQCCDMETHFVQYARVLFRTVDQPGLLTNTLDLEHGTRQMHSPINYPNSVLYKINSHYGLKLFIG